MKKNALQIIIPITIPILIVMVLILVWNLQTNKSLKIINDISKYEEVIGVQTDDLYDYKAELSEVIFPESIDAKEVLNFKFVYYNPFDPQDVAILRMQYTEAEYQAEYKRLSEIGFQEYEGEYGTTGFTNYNLLALQLADNHQGMVYALGDAANEQIIYVELFFCNYYMDLNYTDYIDMEYLPDGFDASEDNPMEQIYVDELNTGLIY